MQMAFQHMYGKRSQMVPRQGNFPWSDRHEVTKIRAGTDYLPIFQFNLDHFFFLNLFLKKSFDLVPTLVILY